MDTCGGVGTCGPQRACLLAQLRARDARETRPFVELVALQQAALKQGLAVARLRAQVMTLVEHNRQLLADADTRDRDEFVILDDGWS